jgi:hypothetical protein
MPEYVNLKVAPYPVDIYIYVNSPNARGKAEQLGIFFGRLPADHLRVLYPIIVMNKKPGGLNGGGTWTAPEVPSNFRAAGHERNTGVPNADVQRIFTQHGSRGLIGISKDRWDRPVERLKFTVMHEVGHCVHNSFRPGGLLASGVRVADLEGMLTTKCGAGDPLERRIVEVYNNYICGSPRISHVPVPRESQQATNSRLIGHLRRSPAFRNVPERWRPQ